jgi:arylsulfatase A-like enzyme
MPTSNRATGTRRLLIGLALTAIFCLPACRRGGADRVPKVPIILLSIDTLRADHLSGYGYGRETSPAIDGFSREAVLFENAVSPSPMTTPAHVSIFTATTPAVHGRANISNFKTEYEPLPARIINAAEVLKANGYVTLGIHGSGNVEGLCGLKRGFDHYAGVPYEGLNSGLEEIIKSHRTSASPFFIFLHHYVCHDPYTRGPKDLRLRFVERRSDEMAALIDEIEELKFSGQKRRRFWRRFDLARQADWETLRALYDGGIRCSDSIFAGMLDVLKKERIYEDALIIVLSDHGEELFEHGGKLHRRLFIETLHVPLIVKFPRGEFGGRRISVDVRTFDLFPTVFEYLGIKERPASFQGESFLPLISGRGSYAPLVMSFSPWGDRIRFHDQGYVFAHEPMPGQETPFWVFDRENDPQEKINLAGGRPDVLRRMESRSRELMREQQERAGLFKSQSGTRVEIDKEVIERLRALGYVK